MIKQEGSPRVSFAESSRVEEGQTLIEILLAFSISILVLSAIVLGVTTSLSNTQYAKNQNLANSYAQEGMAVVRAVRDSNWTRFSSYTTNTIYCLPPNSTELTPASSSTSLCRDYPVGGIFFREVVFNHESSDCSTGVPPTPTPTTILKGSKVTIKVSWSDNKCPVGNPFCHKVELLTCFSNFDQKQSP